LAILHPLHRNFQQFSRRDHGISDAFLHSKQEEQLITFVNTGRYKFVYNILSLTRGRRCGGLVRYGILYDVYSVTRGRHCKSLGGVCAPWVLLLTDCFCCGLADADDNWVVGVTECCYCNGWHSQSLCGWNRRNRWVHSNIVIVSIRVAVSWVSLILFFLFLYADATCCCCQPLGPHVDSLVSLGWCICRGTRGEGDGIQITFPPNSISPCYLSLVPVLLNFTSNFTPVYSRVP